MSMIAEGLRNKGLTAFRRQDIVDHARRFAVVGVARAAAATSVAKDMPEHPVPVMILARLAVNLEHQHAGLGKALLKHALERTAQAADIAGIRALLVHAKDEEAWKWYLN